MAQKQKSADELIDETVRDGGYLVRMYFDLHAKDETEVKNVMVGFIGKLTKEKGVVYAVGEIEQPTHKDGIFSTWAEAQVLVEDFAMLVKIASQYSPIGVEIIRPHDVKLSLGEAQGILLDISQTSQNFTRLIMERMLKPEEVEEYRKKMLTRAELGKKLLEKKQ